jgi:hypothetical protein
MSVCLRVFVCVATKEFVWSLCVYTHTGLHVHIYTVLCPPLEFLIFGISFSVYECMNFCVCVCVCLFVCTFVCTLIALSGNC